MDIKKLLTSMDLNVGNILANSIPVLLAKTFSALFDANALPIVRQVVKRTVESYSGSPVSCGP